MFYYHAKRNDLLRMIMKDLLANRITQKDTVLKIN
jgi:hypothetical protein